MGHPTSSVLLGAAEVLARRRCDAPGVDGCSAQSTPVLPIQSLQFWEVRLSSGGKFLTWGVFLLQISR